MANTTLQGLIQETVRSVTGTALSYNDDWSALFDLFQIPAGGWNGRMLQYLNMILAPQVPGRQPGISTIQLYTSLVSALNAGLLAAGKLTPFVSKNNPVDSALSLWPLPRPKPFPTRICSHTDPMKVNLRGQDRFFNGIGRGPRYDYPNPRGPIYATSLRTWVNPMKQP